MEEEEEEEPVAGPSRFSCPSCSLSFPVKEELDQHISLAHPTIEHQCTVCPFRTRNLSAYVRHSQSHQPQQQSQSHASHVKKSSTKRFFKNRKKKIEFNYHGPGDAYHALSDFKPVVQTELENYLATQPSCKFYISLLAQFNKYNAEAHLQDQEVGHFTSQTVVMSSEELASQFDPAYDRDVQDILRHFDAYCRNGSGWVLNRIQRLDLNLFRYDPLVGRRDRVGRYIPTPMPFTKAVVNVRNYDDDMCFKWAFLAANHSQTLTTRHQKMIP